MYIHAGSIKKEINSKLDDHDHSVLDPKHQNPDRHVHHSRTPPQQLNSSVQNHPACTGYFGPRDNQVMSQGTGYPLSTTTGTAGQWVQTHLDETLDGWSDRQLHLPVESNGVFGREVHALVP